MTLAAPNIKSSAITEFLQHLSAVLVVVSGPVVWSTRDDCQYLNHAEDNYFLLERRIAYLKAKHMIPTRLSAFCGRLMAVQPFDPFVGEVSPVISISRYRLQGPRQCRFWGNVSETPHIFNAFIGHKLLWGSGSRNTSSSGHDNRLRARSNFGREFNLVG